MSPGQPVGLAKLKPVDSGLISEDVLLLVAKEICSDEYVSEPTCPSFRGDVCISLPPEKFVDSSLALQFCTCPICMFMLARPIQPKECEHSACFKCWKHWLRCNDSCPQCRKKINSTTMQPAPLVQWNLLCSLKIKCTFANRGCEAIIMLENFHCHVASCALADAPVLAVHSYNYLHLH